VCGIVGIVGDTQAVPENVFLQMRDSIAHRGPDDAGVWEAESRQARLGSRRLAILDLSPTGHQPMVDDSGQLAITFNGEIYNYLELRDELAGLGHRFRSTSDTEVLLKAYQAWGTDCLQRLNGMFAFAIWDDRRRQLFAARDRFGEKPFYYCQSHNRSLFAFASEIKALVAARLFSLPPNHSAIYRYLAHHELDAGAETLFQGVAALPPAHALLFSGPGSKLEMWRYWDLGSQPECRLAGDAAYAERFLELLSDSVRLRLRSDVPVGSSLSGGLDSSTIVALVAKQGRAQRQATFSARFAEPRFDEGRYIQKITQLYDLEAHQVYPDPASLPREMDALAWHQDHPFESTSIYAQWAVMRLARQGGVTVLLDGQGGDETLAGYTQYFGAYYEQLLRQWHLARLVSSVFCYVRKHGPAALPSILLFMLPQGLAQAARTAARPHGMAADFERQFASEPVRAPARFGDAVHQCMYRTLSRDILPRLLRYADRNSMAFSREVRLPLLDHRLVEFLYAIPADQKIRGTTTKVILRNATRDLLPEEVRNRRDKLGFAAPEDLWLRGPLCSWVDELFASAQFREREWLDVNTVRSAWRAFLQGRTGYRRTIWRWISLELWARNCLAPRSAGLAAPPVQHRGRVQV